MREIITQHNNIIKTLVGKGYSKARWVKYETTKKQVEEFLKWNYSLTDLALKSSTSNSPPLLLFLPPNSFLFPKKPKEKAELF